MWEGGPVRIRVLLIAAALGLTAPGAAVAATPEQVARALQRDPVYVEPGAKPTISKLEAGRIRIRIVQRDIGRIKVAVVKQATAAASGSSAGFANAVDHTLHVRGTLVVSAGTSIHMVTSYSDVDRAVTALRQAVNDKEGDGLGPQLLEGVTRLAAADPGASADGGGEGGGIVDPDVGKQTDKVLGAVKLAVLLVAGAIALPFLLGALWIGLRMRRRRRDERDSLAQDRNDARDQLVALGDRITELDLDESMPDADPQGRAAYERAVEAYQRADEAMGGPPTRTRLSRAAAALAQGRASMEEAGRLLERGAGSRAP
jgi:hypothetical protein